MVRSFRLGFFLSLVIFCFPLNLFSAEILQVRNSSTLQIGDRNRTYTVRMACLKIAPSDEDAALTLLRSELKRGRRVNLRPVGSDDGMLLARVILIDNQEDIGQSLSQAGLATLRC